MLSVPTISSSTPANVTRPDPRISSPSGLIRRLPSVAGFAVSRGSPARMECGRGASLLRGHRPRPGLYRHGGVFYVVELPGSAGLRLDPDAHEAGAGVRALLDGRAGRCGSDEARAASAAGGGAVQAVVDATAGSPASAEEAAASAATGEAEPT